MASARSVAGLMGSQRLLSPAAWLDDMGSTGDTTT